MKYSFFPVFVFASWLDYSYAWLVTKSSTVAGLAAMRKQNEAVQTKTAMHTPQEFSRVKYEREQKMQENARLYHQQFVQQQREKVFVDLITILVSY